MLAEATGGHPGPAGHRIGYVLKMYPRFSETFVVTEVRMMEAHGADLDLFSLRPPVDGRFHGSLALVRAGVHYVTRAQKPHQLWESLAAARAVLGPRVDRALPLLLAADAGDAHQALEVAVAAHRRGLTHLHAHFANVAAVVARLAARLAGITWSMTLHAKDIFHDDVDLALLGDLLADADLAVTVSEHNLDFLRRAFGPEATATLQRLYNGIDLDEFTPTSPREREPVVVGVGRLVEKKGFDDLLEAVAMLRGEGSPVRLELVGGGAEERPLRARAAELGLEDAVRFHGPLTQPETRAVVCRAAVLAAPCVVGADGNRDGLPTVVLESLALGTPVVATPVTGMPEAVRDGETGLLVPERRPAALAAALGRLLEDAGLRVDLAAAGRRLVEERFDTRDNVAELHRMLTDRLPAPRAGADARQPAREEVAT